MPPRMSIATTMTATTPPEIPPLLDGVEERAGDDAVLGAALETGGAGGELLDDEASSRAKRS